MVERGDRDGDPVALSPVIPSGRFWALSAESGESDGVIRVKRIYNF